MVNIKLGISIVFVTFLVGCGGRTDITGLPAFPVSGSVEIDGEPMVDGSIVLHPVASSEDEKPLYLPHGVIKKDGTFRLSTYSQFDGAPAGEYKVVFDWVGPTEGLDEDEVDELEQQLPERLTSPNSTELTVTIVEGENQLPAFELSY